MTGGSWKIQSSLALSGQNQLPNTTAPVGLSLSPSVINSLPYGTGVGTASIIAALSYVLAPSASITINLFDGSINDMSGTAANFRLLRAYAIWISSGGDTSGVTVGNAGSNPHPLFFGATGQTKTIYPGGPEDGGGGQTIPGVAVTSSACNVKITNNSPMAFATVAVNFAGTQCVPGAPLGMLLGLTYP
jgi:hypothetical protein